MSLEDSSEFQCRLEGVENSNFSLKFKIVVIVKKMFEVERVLIHTFPPEGLVLHQAFMVRGPVDIDELLLINYIDIGIPFVDCRLTYILIFHISSSKK